MKKENVLELLEENRNIYLSGEKISSILNVSRQYVWKIINELKQKGYKIECIQNKGYKLKNDCDLISSNFIESKIKIPVFYFNTISSTNIIAKQKYFDIGENIVIANSQFNGITRDNKKFNSPSDNIYFTIAIPLNIKTCELNDFRKKYTDAIVDVINDVSEKKVFAKDLDDIYLNDKKACGIRLDVMINSATNLTECAFIGIGIYLNERNLSNNFCNIKTEEHRNNIIINIYKKIRDLI